MTGPTPGSFGLAKGGGWPMRIVRLGTFSRFGHACICEAVDAAGRAWIIEPMPTGCRVRLAEPGEFVWSDIPLTENQAQAIVTYARECVGLPYDWRSIAGFVLRFWGAKVRGRSDDHADDRLLCSEMVVWAYRRAGIDLAPGKAPGDVSPGDLDEFLDNRRRA